MTGKQQEPTPGVCLREMSKQPSQLNSLSLLFCHFFVHSCLVLCCLIAFSPIHLLISLLLVICFKLTRTFFDFPCRFKLSGVDCSYSKMTDKWQGPTPGVHLREVSDLKGCPLRERYDCNILICTCRSHCKILKVMNLIFTGSGLSLRAGGRGFSPATQSMVPGYFRH